MQLIVKLQQVHSSKSFISDVPMIDNNPGWAWSLFEYVGTFALIEAETSEYEEQMESG